MSGRQGGGAAQHVYSKGAPREYGRPAISLTRKLSPLLLPFGYSPLELLASHATAYHSHNRP